MSTLVIGCVVIALLVYGLADDYMSKTPNDKEQTYSVFTTHTNANGSNHTPLQAIGVKTKSNQYLIFIMQYQILVTLCNPRKRLKSATADSNWRINSALCILEDKLNVVRHQENAICNNTILGFQDILVVLLVVRRGDIRGIDH